MVRSSVLNVFSQSYEVSKGLIDLSDSTQVTGGGALDKIVNALVMKDLKTPGFAKNLIKGATAAGEQGNGKDKHCHKNGNLLHFKPPVIVGTEVVLPCYCKLSQRKFANFC